MAECVRQSAARTPPACAHTHTHTHSLTHTHTHTHKGKEPYSRSRSPSRRRRRRRRGRRAAAIPCAPAPAAAGGASPHFERGFSLRGADKMGEACGACAGGRASARGGPGAGGPGPGGRAAAPRFLGRPAATEVLGVGAEWREGVRSPPRAAPRLSQIKKKKILPWLGGGRQSNQQEWLLSLILVYSKKLQTGRV
ncbi:protein vestigial-like [Zalophus californianus]|uniref:Protein vestigial-like n=1 Tax=Zalophus californianus TaxID=9704 RepID=A0A6J2CNU2_ZALCA|nr:protein vestigial-like [Zalophus californianus]